MFSCWYSSFSNTCGIQKYRSNKMSSNQTSLKNIHFFLIPPNQRTKSLTNHNSNNSITIRKNGNATNSFSYIVNFCYRCTGRRYKIYQYTGQTFEFFFADYVEEVKILVRTCFGWNLFTTLKLAGADWIVIIINP